MIHGAGRGLAGWLPPRCLISSNNIHTYSTALGKAVDAVMEDEEDART